MKVEESLKYIRTLRESVKAKKINISEKTLDLMEKMVLNMNGDYSSKGRVSIQEAITTTDVAKLIPKIVEGKLLEAAEPNYLGTNFLTNINVEGENSIVYVIPVAGEVNVYEVGEGTPYRETSYDENTLENYPLQVKIKKIGAKVAITEEAIATSTWDIFGMNVKKMGRAMARYKETDIFNQFSTHGNVVYDNNVRTQMPEMGTTGRDEYGNFNDTVSVEDMLDMTLAIMSEGFNPTDIIMHPLTWVIFAKNSMIGNGLSFGAFGGNNVSPWGTIQGTPGPMGMQNNGNGQKLIMNPSQVQNRLPVPLNINFSPFVHFDKQNKLFDMYCVDRNEVGILAQAQKMTLDKWTDPERDIHLLKVKERYGVGISNNGRGITVCKNIAVAPTYPKAPNITVDVNTKTK